MIIPGFIISILSFPGVIVHEFAHKLFCHWTGTRVIRVCYFRVGNPSGYVVHERPSNIWKHIWIGIGPLFINTLAGFIIGLFVTPQYRPEAGGIQDVANIVLAWLAVAVAMHSFPSSGDARSIWSEIWRKGAPVSARLVGSPLVGVIYLGAIGSIFCLNIAYGAVVLEAALAAKRQFL